MARSWSVAHEGVRSGRSSGNGAASPYPSAWGCSSIKTPSEVSSWTALPGDPSVRRARTAVAVRSDNLDDTSVASDVAAPSWPVYRGHSAGAARFTRATSSSKWSRTDDRQLRRHFCVGEARVVFPPRTGAASAIRGKSQRRARATHVFSGSVACSRQVRARAPLEEAAMCSMRSVRICLASSWRISKPWGGSPDSGQRVCAGAMGGASCRECR